MKTIGKPFENLRITMGKPLENYGETEGNHRKTIEKLGNHRKTIGNQYEDHRKAKRKQLENK